MIGQRIRELRQLRGWSARELSRRAGSISRGTLAKIECGVSSDLKLSQAITLARVLGVTVESLADVDIPPEAIRTAAEIADGKQRLADLLSRNPSCNCEKMRTMEGGGPRVFWTCEAHGTVLARRECP